MNCPSHSRPCGGQEGERWRDRGGEIGGEREEVKGRLGTGERRRDKEVGCEAGEKTEVGKW